MIDWSLTEQTAEFILMEPNCLEVESQTYTTDMQYFGQFPPVDLVNVNLILRRLNAHVLPLMQGKRGVLAVMLNSITVVLLKKCPLGCLSWPSYCSMVPFRPCTNVHPLKFNHKWPLLGVFAHTWHWNVQPNASRVIWSDLPNLYGNKHAWFCLPIPNVSLFLTARGNS